MKESGFEIEGRTYPFVGSFRLGDPVLVERLTGLDWNEWTDRLPDEDDPTGELNDPLVMLGMVGVAVWQTNPRWSREKVARYVEQLDMSAVEVHAPDVEEDDTLPPTETAETKMTDVSAVSLSD